MGTPEVVVLGRPVIPASTSSSSSRTSSGSDRRFALWFVDACDTGQKKTATRPSDVNRAAGSGSLVRERANPSGGTAPAEPSVRLERISSQPGLLPQQHGIVNDFGPWIKNPDG